MGITKEMLSPYSKACLQELGLSRQHTVTKLISTLTPKTRYLVSARNLQFYLRNGLELKKIHRGLVFRQEAFVRPFVDKCSRMRMKAETKTEQEMWKLLLNSLYGEGEKAVCNVFLSIFPIFFLVFSIGKFIESPDKRMNVYFNNTYREAAKHAGHPLHKGTLIMEEDLSVSFLKKKETVMSQSWAIGFSILELAKYIMQRLYYEVIIPRLGEGNVSLNMTDTDSFLLTVNGSSESDVLEKLADVMDFSNLAPDDPLYDASRKKKPGLLKNEMPTCRILETTCVRAKCYAIVTDAGNVSKCKGVSKAAKPSPETYKSCVVGKRRVVTSGTNTRIRSRNHTNEVVRERKQCFSSFDDKRFLMCEVNWLNNNAKQNITMRDKKNISSHLFFLLTDPFSSLWQRFD